MQTSFSRTALSLPVNTIPPNLLGVTSRLIAALDTLIGNEESDLIRYHSHLSEEDLVELGVEMDPSYIEEKSSIFDLFEN
jgi:hypothetical protein